MKIGDNVIYMKKISLLEEIDLISAGAEVPRKDRSYKIIGFTAKGNLILEDLPHGRRAKGWNKKYWKKVEPDKISTHASARLAAFFAERDGCPEILPGEITHLPEEKKFTTDKDF